jgi:serine/threonine protein kinase
MTPTHIGQFEIKHVLGTGGMGTVYAAVDTELGRWVAIKTLKPEIGRNPAMQDRFRAEGVSLGRLNHTNITTLYGMPRDGDELFLVMELVNGRTLDAVLSRTQRLGVAETLAIVVQTAAGLDYAHRMGVIHRDIKPSNLMLTEAGVVKIMDFGIARIRGTQRLTQAGLLGTYAYLAPEQFRRGEGTERSDLYSLACVVYEMLSGAIPFDAPTEAEMMRGHLEVNARPLHEVIPGIDQKISAAVARALAKDPAQRFANVEEFSDAIGAASYERTSSGVIRDRILSRVPAPVRPTVQMDVLPGGTRSSGPSPGASRPGGANASRAQTAFMRGKTLGFASAAVVSAAAVVWLALWPPWEGGDETRLPARPVPETNLDHQPAPPPPRPSSPVPATPRNEPSNGLLPRSSKSADTPDFIPNPVKPPLAMLNAAEVIARGLAPSDLVAEAQRRFATGQGQQVNEAIDLLEYAAKAFHYPPASGALARIYDPDQASRPQGLQPDLGLAARYYSAADKGGDTTSAPERERFRRYLEDLSHGHGMDASTAAFLLKQYW